MSSSNETDLRETIRSLFRGKAVERVELFGSAVRGGMTPQSDVDISSHQARRPRTVIFSSWPQKRCVETLCRFQKRADKKYSFFFGVLSLEYLGAIAPSHRGEI